MQAMGLEKPAHMDRRSFLPLASSAHKENSLATELRYPCQQNYPQTPTNFSLPGAQYKYTTYYELWDTDELFDIQKNPGEQHNLIHDPKLATTKQTMQYRLYDMMVELVGMEIPMNPLRGRQQNKRLRHRDGEDAADFPEALIVDEPLRKDIR